MITTTTLSWYLDYQLGNIYSNLERVCKIIERINRKLKRYDTDVHLNEEKTKRDLNYTEELYSWKQKDVTTFKKSVIQ